MNPVPPPGHDRNEQTPPEIPAGFSYSHNGVDTRRTPPKHCSERERGDAGCTHPACHREAVQDDVDALDWLDRPEPDTSLDIEKHPCNEDGSVCDCRLPDDWIPSPEWRVPPISDAEARFWHSGHARERQAVYEAYRAMGRHRPLHRFVNCGSDVRVLVRARIGDDIAFRLSSNRCRDRFCPLCARCRSTTLAANVSALIESRHATVRLITLTLRHSDTPLRDQLKRLTQSFNALKRRDFWTQHVVGGVMFTEIKIGRDNRWHVHCHIMAEGSYISSQELSQQWHAVTGDSPVVDVRAVKDVKTAAGYIAKYGSKPCDRSVLFSPQRLIEAIAALRGTRLCTTFGEWRGHKLTAPPKDSSSEGWAVVGSLNSLVTSDWWEAFQILKPEWAERVKRCIKLREPPSG